MNILPLGLDFETIPTQDEDIIEDFKRRAKLVKVSPPTAWGKVDFARELKLDPKMVDGMGLPGLKQMWIDRNLAIECEKNFNDAYRKTSFSAQDGGEIISGAFKIFGDDASGKKYMESPVNVYRHKGGDSEIAILNKMVNWLDMVDDEAKRRGLSIMFVGANVRNFDMRFFGQRCLMNGILPPKCGLLAPSYDRTRYFDVLSTWCFDDNKSSISLDRLCKALKIETPKDDQEGPINGSMVWDIWNTGGEHGASRIGAYNVRDVIVLEPIFEILKNLRA